MQRDRCLTARPIAGLAALAALPAAEAFRGVRQHPELADTGAEPLVVAVAARDATEAALRTDVLSVVKFRLSEDRQSREHVLRTLLPAERLLTLSPAVLEQVNRNAAALAEEFGLLSSTQVAQRAKSKSLASNPAALANRWRQEQKVFAVDVDGIQRFPGFQFGGNGRPLPVIADVLAAVGDRLTGWALALWFTGGSGWARRAAPRGRARWRPGAGRRGRLSPRRRDPPLNRGCPHQHGGPPGFRRRSTCRPHRALGPPATRC